MSTLFEHEALFYDGTEAFLDGVAPFLRDGVEAGEPVLVAVDRKKIDLLRAALGDAAVAVTFLDMTLVGRNPARIIPVWSEFVHGHAAGAPCRGVGEPLWPGRSDGERAECHRHEELLNLAFAGADGFRLLCPYDSSLAPADLDRSRRNHAYVTCGAERRASDPGAGGRVDVFDDPLPEIDGDPLELTLRSVAELSGLRSTIAELGRLAGLGPLAGDFALAVNEVGANSLRHGGGRAEVRLWWAEGSLVCEVRDRGHVAEPLAGRVRPAPDQAGGRGLWLVNHLCDLVELRTSPAGTAVRLRIERVVSLAGDGSSSASTPLR